MAFGILEDSQNSSPPGTTLLENISSSRTAEIVLVPQPRNSLHDPLNWSRIWKELLFLTIVLGCCATGVMGPHQRSFRYDNHASLCTQWCIDNSSWSKCICLQLYSSHLRKSFDLPRYWNHSGCIQYLVRLWAELFVIHGG